MNVDDLINPNNNPNADVLGLLKGILELEQKYGMNMADALENAFKTAQGEQVEIQGNIGDVLEKDVIWEEVEPINRTRTIRGANYDELPPLEDEPGEELTEDVENLINTQEELKPLIYDQPILKSLAKNNDKSNYGIDREYESKVDKTIKGYELAVLETGLTAFKRGLISNKGNIVITDRQGLELLTGNSRDFEKKQRDDYKNAWFYISSCNHTFTSTTQLLEEIGLGGDLEEITSILSDDKEEIRQGTTTKSGNIAEVTAFDYVKKGKPVTAYLIKFNDVIKSIINKYDFSEYIPENTLKVLTYNGEDVTTWRLTKDRIALRNYIYSWVYKLRRAIAVNKENQVTNIKPYKDIFEGANVKLDQNKRRLKDIKVIFEHLKQEGIIINYSEYSTKGEKARGIKVYMPDRRLIVEEDEI